MSLANVSSAVTQTLLLSVTSLGMLVSASPAQPPPQDRPLDVLAKLRQQDHQSGLNWTTTASGGRMTKVQGASPYNRLVRTRDNSLINGLGIDFGDWSSITSQIDALSGKYKCEEGGVEYGLLNVVKPYVTQACGELTGSTVPGAAANNAWQIWQSFGANINPTGTPSRLNFGLQNNGKNPPQLTQQLCNDAYGYLTGTAGPCQSTGGTTEGGIIRFGDDNNWLSFLLDPQEDTKSLGE